MESRSKWPLVIGIVIPVALVFALIIFIYSPISSLSPQYDFLYYSLDNSSSCYNFNPYQVVGGRIDKTPLPVVDKVSPESGGGLRDSYTSACSKLYSSSTPQLYLFEVAKNNYRKVSLEEAQSLRINPDPVSADNIRVSNNYNSPGFGVLFGGDSGRNSFWLEGQRGNKEINLSPSVSNYYQFKFVGWITK